MTPEAVIFIGLQAAGKTTFYRERLRETHVHISRDVLKTKQRQADAIDVCLTAGKSFVLDNTNPAVIDRTPVIALAKAAGFRVVGIYFRSAIDECAARNVGRPNAVPPVALRDAARRLALPTMEEGFDELRYVRIPRVPCRADGPPAGPSGHKVPDPQQDFVVEEWHSPPHTLKVQ